MELRNLTLPHSLVEIKQLLRCEFVKARTPSFVTPFSALAHAERRDGPDPSQTRHSPLPEGLVEPKLAGNQDANLAIRTEFYLVEIAQPVLVQRSGEHPVPLGHPGSLPNNHQRCKRLECVAINPPLRRTRQRASQVSRDALVEDQ